MPSRVACCPLTVHALLHIAPTIRAMGPVWAYWAFLMERHCSDILCNIRSRQFPYASINKYVASHAQLTHITLLYNLHEKLQLKPPTSHDDDVCLPSCEPLHMSMNMHAYCYEPDPSYILTPPKQIAVILPLSLWKTLTATLATRFDKPAAIIRKLIPQKTHFVQYGRAQRLEGGDTMHARELIPLKSDSRDMSFVRVWILLNYLNHNI